MIHFPSCVGHRCILLVTWCFLHKVCENDWFWRSLANKLRCSQWPSMQRWSRDIPILKEREGQREAERSRRNSWLEWRKGQHSNMNSWGVLKMTKRSRLLPHPQFSNLPSNSPADCQIMSRYRYNVLTKWKSYKCKCLRWAWVTDVQSFPVYFYAAFLSVWRLVIIQQLEKLLDYIKILSFQQIS